MWARMRKATLSDAVGDAAWAILAPLLAPVTRRGRPRRHDRRLVLEAVFDVRRGGLAWRLLPGHVPPWRGVDDQFRRWRQAGLWERINAALRERGRRRARPGRRPKDRRPQAASWGRPAGLRPARPCPSGRRARSARRRGRARRPRSALSRGHLPVRRQGRPGPWPMARRAARLAAGDRRTAEPLGAGAGRPATTHDAGRLPGAAEALDRGEDVRVARATASAGRGLGAAGGHHRDLDLPRHEPPHGKKARQGSSLDYPNTL